MEQREIYSDGLKCLSNIENISILDITESTLWGYSTCLIFLDRGRNYDCGGSGPDLESGQVYDLPAPGP